MLYDTTLLRITNSIKLYYKTLFIVFILLVPLFAASQVYPIPLHERIDSSKKVMIGKVIEANSYWEADSSSIYTSYTMEIVCFAKNWDNHSFFDLILPGGIVGEEAQVNYPYIQLNIGYEYMVAVEDISLYTLNRRHARSSNPSFQPYSYVQGVLPMHNGYYQDYFDTIPVFEEDFIEVLETITGEQATTPAGSDWEARDTFPISNGDIDEDGVLDIYDVDPSDPNSNSDRDSFTDIEEKLGSPTYAPSDPLNPCDPQPGANGCIPIDLDNDNLYGNFPSVSSFYDPDDNNSCIPNTTTSDCVPTDADGDGYYSNYNPNDSLFDPDDANTCIPNNALSFGCPPEDVDQDGLYANADPTTNNYDPNDWNPCIPHNNVFEIPAAIEVYIVEENSTTDNENSDTPLSSNDPEQEQEVLFRFDDIRSTLPSDIPVDAFISGQAFLKLYIDSPNGTVPEIVVHEVENIWESGDSGQSVVNRHESETGEYKLPRGRYKSFELMTFPVDGGVIEIEIDLTQIFQQILENPNEVGFMMMIKTPNEYAIDTMFSSESPTPPILVLYPDEQNCNITPPTTRKGKNMVLKNGKGETTNSFVGGTIDEEHEMVIQGSGFGNETGHVKFANTDTGGFTTTSLDKGTDLVHWTDTEIRFKVPNKAGTGDMVITDKAGSIIGTLPIEVTWSINPIYHQPRSETEKFRQRSHFVNVNETGGYNILVNTSTGFADNTEAMAAFERALTSWQCATNVNWSLSDNTATESGKDGFSVLEFSDKLPQGVLAITSSRYKGSGSSNCPEHNLFWRIYEFDISFADPSILPSGFNWNFTSNNPAADEFDFESIALHELGHAHGLAHVIDESSVMHFSILNGEMKRELHTHETEGAQFKMGYSTTDNCINSHDPMVAISSPCATPAAFNKTNIKVFLEGFFNGSTGEMSTHLNNAGLIPVSQPFNKAPFNYIGTESVTSIPANIVDWVLLELRDPTNQESVLYQKAVFLKNDGSLVNLDGTTEITLEGVSSGDYYIGIAHTNHLSVISNTTHLIGTTANLYDFSSTVSAAMGAEQLKEVNGQFYLHSGDFDGNGLINNQDYNLWKINSSSLNIYSPADADGNGIINSLDYNLWKVNLSKIGLITR